LGSDTMPWAARRKRPRKALTGGTNKKKLSKGKKEQGTRRTASLERGSRQKNEKRKPSEGNDSHHLPGAAWPLKKLRRGKRTNEGGTR